MRQNSNFPEERDEGPADNALEDSQELDAGPGADPEAVADAQAKIAERLQMFGERLAKRRDEWVRARAAQGLDRQWNEDLDQFNGKDNASRANASMMKSVEQGFPATLKAQAPTRSTVFVQATRQKTNAAAARLGDVCLPTDESNYNITCTSLPTLPSFVQLPATAPDKAPPAAPQMPAGPSEAGGPQPAAQGTPQMPPGPATAPTKAVPTQLDEATKKLLAEYAEAKKRSEAMKAEIDDSLEQCDYNAEARRVIHNAALFGTGVMKGPIVVNRTKRVWSKKTDQYGSPFWVKEVVDELKPASFSLDPRFFYPDPLCGDNVQNGRGAYEYEKLTSKMVRELVNQPEYNELQLRRVLDEGPKPSKAMADVREQEEMDVSGEGVYELWVYWGEIDREDLVAAGVEVDEEDDLQSISACVEMINSTVVRAYLNPLVDGRLPYDMFPWETRPGTVWGYGVPYLMRAQQRVINAAWRMILDNAGVSSGPQIVLKAGAVNPANKEWTLTSRKIWFADDTVDDVSKAFATFEFDSHQKELQAIIEMAEKLSDQETAVPMIAQGERGAAPETVGGMQLLMNSMNVMLRRLVKNFDDRLTKPHIRKYYDYLMEYSERDDIKGDFDVVALGSSSLVVRDIQNQAVTNMLSLGGNPVYSPFINLKKLFEKALRAQHIDPADVMNSDDEIARIQQIAAQNPPKDPRLEAAEVRAKADMDRTKAQVAMNSEVVRAKHEATIADVQLRMQSLQVEREIEMMKLAQKENVSLETIRAQLAAVGIKERSKQDMQAREIQLAAARGEGI